MRHLNPKHSSLDSNFIYLIEYNPDGSQKPPKMQIF